MINWTDAVELKDALRKKSERIEDMERVWKRAERQISAGLKKHGLELHTDVQGNYTVVKRDPITGEQIT